MSPDRSPDVAAARARPPARAIEDRCVRCGRPTPAGVALCERDNPGQLKGPSATQAHGTIFLGVVAGFVLLAVLASFSVAGIGPFESRLTAANQRADRGADLVVSVTNRGSRESAASCRVSRGPIATGDDLVFLTDPIPPGETREFQRTVPATAAGPVDVRRLVVRCS